MKRKAIISAIMATCLTTGGFAFAQSYETRDHGGRIELAQHGDDRERRDDRRDVRGDRHEGRGAGPNHNFYRGERLPRDYNHRQYVVDDWRAHHLRQPPRGYHWVQTGGDYVLAAIATGIIADILLNN